MAAPNIRAATGTIVGKTVGQAATTSLADFISNASGSGTVIKVESLYFANTDSATGAGTVKVFKGASGYSLANAVSLSANDTAVIIDSTSPIFLEEGDKIQILRSSAATCDVIASYLVIS